MPRILGVDIETYSSAPLSKCGVYRYSDAPDFEILLFSYAYDDEPVQTVDMACGERLPADVLSALGDPQIIKMAYNAQFERVCISKHLGHWLDPAQWRCTAVMSSYLTLPARLGDVAVALGVTEKKMEEGKDLIRYFSVPCKATKTNDGRTRNLPKHVPDKWAVYKQYNAQDVETERAVRKELEAHSLPEHEWELYALDQRINDRGVRVDRLLVKQAMSVDQAFSAQTFQRARDLTGLENPGSVSQLKAWLADQDMPMESLAKKIVQEKAASAEGVVGELLNLRLELSKTSVKKYEAMARYICRDGRVRGMTQFYGASRTGRWCLSGDHEVLTPKGWTRLDVWQGGAIACWDSETEAVSFQEASALCFPYSGSVYHYVDQHIDQISTPDHKMRFQRRFGGEWVTDTVQAMSACRPCIPIYGYSVKTTPNNAKNLRVLVMVQADGMYTKDGILQLTLRSQQKIERCKTLLREAGIEFTCTRFDNATRFSIPARKLPLWLRMFSDKTFGPWLFDENPDVFFDELVHWYGCRQTKNSFQYCTCNQQNADLVQAFAHMSGRSAIILKKAKSKEHRAWSDVYYVDICDNLLNAHEIRSMPTIDMHDGTVYCAETRTGFFLVRRNGKVWVTGNSGRGIQLQNLPQNHLPDLRLARDIVKTGDEAQLELLFGSVPGTLSELIRTAFIPKDGCRFIVADFSAIEARVLAWLAGEEWVLDEFRGRGKIYEATAARMYSIPAESIVKGKPNYEYRQKGKQATLSCGYGGGVGALKAMGAKMPEEEMQPLVDAWRAANPHIVALWGALDRAARKVIEQHTSARVGRLTLYWQDDRMFIRLPAGRNLCYISPRFVPNRFGNTGVGYLAPAANGRLMAQETFGGKLAENVTQGIARDLLAHGMMQLEAEGYPIVFHVHDEVVMEVPIGQGSVEEACEIMARAPAWAEGLPLRADGDEMPFYQKS